ncbi:MAG: GAF domain-containing protein [Burkholderiales bacterium]|nr:GAF domain-containing protein [Burkholderiales bacterium]
MSAEASRVDLSNCDREPIHIPGLIQPHGALLALDAEQRVLHASANLADWLGGAAPALGDRLAPHHFEASDTVHALLAQAQALPAVTSRPAARHAVVTLAGRTFDLLVHRQQALVIAEFEQRRLGAPPQYLGPTLLEANQHFRSQTSVQGLLEAAVQVLRTIIGFDRVMAYRFRADDSGDIVAEDRHPELDPYLSWRFPASDIPAQARRLYTDNLMRLIADVNAAPVALRSLPPDDAPLDLSHAVLRSVSPIHIEYLQNIGVRASMSLSIVRDGRLWGMLACHHRQPMQLSYPVRSACAVLTELLAAHLQAHTVAEQAAQATAHQRLRGALLDRLPQASSPAAVLRELAPELGRLFRADAVLVAGPSGVQVWGDVPAPLSVELTAWLRTQSGDEGGLVVTTALGTAAPQLAPVLAGWCGLMAIRYDSGVPGKLALLRREQIEHVHWGHPPQRDVPVGPLGPRLTPPGSFQLWRETVRGTALAWTEMERAALRELGADLRRFVADRVAEMHRHRVAVAAMLRQGEASTAPLTGDDTSHVDRLLRQVMDLSLLQQGRLSMASAPVALDQLLKERVDAARQRHQGISVFFDSERAGLPATRVRGDAVRLAQLFDSLLDNAVQHGTAGESIVVQLNRGEAGEALAEFSNVSPPLAPQTVQKLFRPDLSAVIGDDARAGLGFGLYIARAIAQGHGGDLAYSHDDPFVTLTVRLPLMPA